MGCGEPSLCLLFVYLSPRSRDAGSFVLRVCVLNCAQSLYVSSCSRQCSLFLATSWLLEGQMSFSLLFLTSRGSFMVCFQYLPLLLREEKCFLRFPADHWGIILLKRKLGTRKAISGEHTSPRHSKSCGMVGWMLSGRETGVKRWARMFKGVWVWRRCLGKTEVTLNIYTPGAWGNDEELLQSMPAHTLCTELSLFFIFTF